MKTITLTALCLSIGVASLKAQTKDASFDAGTNIVSAGVGLGSDLDNWGYGSQSPALNLQYERGIWQAGPGVVSLGAYAGYKTFKYSASFGPGQGGYTEKWNYSIVGVRGAYHYTGLHIDNLDLYGGVMLSYDDLSYKYTNTENQQPVGGSGSWGSTVGFTVYAGAKYYFAGNLGLLRSWGMAYRI